MFPQAYILSAPGAVPPTISLPSGAGDAPLALPSLATAGSADISGLLIPAFPADPTTLLPNGTIYFRDGLRVLVAGEWRLAQTL